MQNLPVVTNAFSSVSCVLLTQIILEKNIKRIKCHSERMIEVGVSKGEMMQKRRLQDLQRGFLQTLFSKDWIHLQEHVVVGFNSSCYDIH